MILIKSPSKKLTIKLMIISLTMMVQYFELILISLTSLNIQVEKIDHLIGDDNVCYD